MTLNNNLVELLQISVGVRDTFSAPIDKEAWKSVYKEAQKQTIAGVLYAAIEKLPADQRPPREVLLRWYAMAEQIKRANALLNEKSAHLTQHFNEADYRSVVLKGQGVAQLYPHPELRIPGDIDLWVEGERQTLIHFMAQHAAVEGITYHHCDYNLYKDVPVEVHYTPSWMYSPRLNRKLQKFFEDQAPAQFSNQKELLHEGQQSRIGVPTNTFNSVYLLVHLFRHVMFEGVGLRQLMDYYYALVQGQSSTDKEYVRRWLRDLRLTRFAGAVMYALQEVFALKEEYMLVAPVRKDGELLLSEIGISGNFGKYDERRKDYRGVYSWHALRVLKFWSWCPEEVICAVPFKIWHWGWRRKQTRELKRFIHEQNNIR